MAVLSTMRLHWEVSQDDRGSSGFTLAGIVSKPGLLMDMLRELLVILHKNIKIHLLCWVVACCTHLYWKFIFIKKKKKKIHEFLMQKHKI